MQIGRTKYPFACIWWFGQTLNICRIIAEPLSLNVSVLKYLIVGKPPFSKENSA